MANEAKIGNTEYATLKEAFAAAQDGDTITLLGNITIDSMLTISKNVTIDGSGLYSITASENDAWKGQQMIQVSKANVSFKNLTLDGASQSITLIQAVKATGLTLDGVTMQNARNGIYKGSTFNNGGLTVNNSTINVKVFAFNATGDLAFINVNDSTLYGWTSFNSDLSDALATFKNTNSSKPTTVTAVTKPSSPPFARTSMQSSKAAPSPKHSRSSRKATMRKTVSLSEHQMQSWI